jgi:hypothetical protein
MSPEEATQALNTWDPLQDEWGCYLTVDIDCPPEIHDYVNAYPLIPERGISDPSAPKWLRDQLKDKLVCTLYKKIQYKVHLLYLLVGLALGYKVTKVYG